MANVQLLALLYCRAFNFIGLFLADQHLRGTTSKHTRQNPNGGRSGYECPEERDYYPYWHPTDWIDDTVYVKRQEDCAFYESESFNHQMKGVL